MPISPKGTSFIEAAETQSMKTLSKEIAQLTEYYSMVKIHWQAHYVKKDNSHLSPEFDVFYFVQIMDAKVKIFAYVVEDEQKTLKERGLI